LRSCAGVLFLLSGLLAFGQYEDPETAMRRADTALGQGRFDVAQSIYDHTLHLNPNITVSAWRCRNIAEANLRATHGDLKVGADWLQRAVDQAPADVSNRQRLAEILLRAAEPARAASQYRILLKKDPLNQPYVLGLATALRNIGQLDEGASLLASTLQQHPEYSQLRIEYGRNLSYQHQYQAAREQYERVLRSEPDHVEAQIGLAKAYSWEGNQQQALVGYEKALLKDPANYDVLVGQAFALIWSGRPNEALPILERANSRHPEDGEVREALRKLGGVNVFTGEVRAGEPEWPVLAPSMKKVPEKAVRGARGTFSSAVPPASAGSSNSAEASSTEPAAEAKPEGQPAAPGNNTPAAHSVMWVVGMGLATMVAVFVAAGFLLFVLPTMKNKKEGKTAPVTRVTEVKAEMKPIEPWARLEQFSRVPIRESPRPVKTPIAASTLAELLPAPSPATQEVEPEPSFEARAEPVMSVEESPTALTSAASVEPGLVPLRPARRRRGVTERPWWKDLSNPELISAVKEEPELALPADRAEQPALEAEPAPAQMIAAPYGDATFVVPSDRPNPLTPASAKPAPPEEPPPVRPFTMVLSRALERAGDGQADEQPDVPKSQKVEHRGQVANGNGTGRFEAEQAPSVEPLDVESSPALGDASVVIVGCGVMVSHYKTLLRAAGADVRIFTFWDLAMSSMRKRRADVLLIDGDALDGLTPVQMYTSAQVERYMFGAVLVGISSDEDSSDLPEEVVLAHSLSDDDLRSRFVESLQAS
jgi:tetratricopeptide (TPR) repeat protein